MPAFVFHFYDHPDLIIDGQNQGFIIAYAEDFGVGDRSKKLLFPEHYKLVAELETESLEEAFRLTNSIDFDWRSNRKVCTTPIARRSTSVEVAWMGRSCHRLYHS